MEVRRTRSTSSSTASVDDVILRDGSTTRLIFRPTIVANPKNNDAAVRGTFIFQRKGRTENWEDMEKIPLNTLKKGEGYQLELKSSEVLDLFQELSSLYNLYETTGIPMGTQKFVRVPRQLGALANLKQDELVELIKGQEKLGNELLLKLISWAGSEGNLSEPLIKLIENDVDAAENLNTALGVAALKESVGQYNSNLDNPSEEYWQKFFEKNRIFLEQIFAYPVVIIKGKAYVGGKSVDNTGGNIADFLIQNELTKNVAIIEIKTPKTRLLGEEYRSGIFNASRDLTGAILQVVSYKRTLGLEFNSLKKSNMEMTNPYCVVIIGNAGNELMTENHRSSFEGFRSQLSGVQVITFDEVIRRAERLISIFEAERESA